MAVIASNATSRVSGRKESLLIISSEGRRLSQEETIEVRKHGSIGRTAQNGRPPNCSLECARLLVPSPATSLVLFGQTAEPSPVHARRNRGHALPERTRPQQHTVSPQRRIRKLTAEKTSSNSPSEDVPEPHDPDSWIKSRAKKVAFPTLYSKSVIVSAVASLRTVTALGGLAVYRVPICTPRS
jgi:hypothetical protein